MKKPRRQSYLERNLVRVFRARACWARSVSVPAGAVEAAVADCLMTLRPRNRWPENTRAYEFLRSRLDEAPLTVLTAVGAVISGLLYLGFGQTALDWFQTLLRVSL